MRQKPSYVGENSAFDIICSSYSLSHKLYDIHTLISFIQCDWSVCMQKYACLEKLIFSKWVLALFSKMASSFKST